MYKIVLQCTKLYIIVPKSLKNVYILWTLSFYCGKMSEKTQKTEMSENLRTKEEKEIIDYVQKNPGASAVEIYQATRYILEDITPIGIYRVLLELAGEDLRCAISTRETVEMGWYISVGWYISEEVE